jgi:HPt (histidine-containing phosphotransfer) domain-containing protein
MVKAAGDETIVGDDDEAPFDIAGLNDMYGQETVAELLQMSVDESRGLLDQIRTGQDEKDSKIVMAAAHQLKGLASTMTINKLAGLCFELESLARQEQWESIPDVADRLNVEFERVRTYIASVLA